MMSAKKFQRINIPDDLHNFLAGHATIGICNNVSTQNLVRIAHQYGICHLVQSSQAEFELEKQTSEIMIQDLDTYLRHPISTILEPSSIQPETENRLTVLAETAFCIDQKPAVMEKLRQELRKLKRSEYFISEFLVAADELFTNAIFNAPYVSFELNRRVAPRTGKYGNNPDIKPFRIFMGANAKRIVLGCEDHYGSLNPNLLIGRLKGCLEQGPESTTKWVNGVGGFGSYMILRSASSYYVGVSKNKATVVCCTFPIDGSRLGGVKSIHFGLTGSDSLLGSKNMNSQLKLSGDSQNWKIELFNVVDEKMEFPKPVAGLKSLIVDFANVTYINSAGLFRWSRWLKALRKENPDATFEFQRLVASFIRAQEMSIDVIPPFCTVTSLFFDYFCANCGDSKHLLRDNVSGMENETVDCESCGIKMEFDLSKQSYQSIQKLGPKKSAAS